MTTGEILAAFRGLRVLVVGDVCLDRWCRYDPALADPSRETGIPRIGVISTEVTAGAAGTVANNLAALGAGRVAILGMVGDDGFGYELRGALDARGIESGLLVNAPGIPTFTYTKLINHATGIEDLPRVDFVYTRELPPEIDREIVARFRQVAGEFDVILVSDQAETELGGVVTPRMREALADVRALVWVDSRMRPEHFRNAVVKPNQHEAEAASRRLFGRVDYAAFREHIAAPALIVTFGGDGALVVTAGGEHRVRTRPVEHPVDICGAGDSFSAGAAMTLKVSGDPVLAAEFGNRVANITIMKKGTGTASPEEVLAADA